MTAGQQPQDIVPGDKLVIRMGFSDDLKEQEGEVLATLNYGFLLIKFQGGILYANTWLVPEKEDYMGGKAVINPANSEDCESQDELVVHQINAGAFMDDTYEGALLEIVSINGKQITHQ